MISTLKCLNSGGVGIGGELETLEESNRGGRNKWGGWKDCFEIYDSTAMKHFTFIKWASMVLWW